MANFRARPPIQDSLVNLVIARFDPCALLRLPEAFPGLLMFGKNPEWLFHPQALNQPHGAPGTKAGPNAHAPDRGPEFAPPLPATGPCPAQKFPLASG